MQETQVQSPGQEDPLKEDPLKEEMASESEVAQSCLTLSDPMDCSRPGSSIHGIFQARVPQWGAIATPIFLLGEFHGQSSLADYSPWDHKVRHD